MGVCFGCEFGDILVNGVEDIGDGVAVEVVVFDRLLTSFIYALVRDFVKGVE